MTAAVRFHGKRHPIAAEYARFPVPLRAIRPVTPAETATAWRALRNPANIRRFGQSEAAYPNAVCYYHPPFLRALFAALGRHIRPLLDFDIVETYYYARLYGTGDQLKLHTDRGACFVSVSLCLGYEFSDLFPEGSAWPIGVLDDEGGSTDRGTPVLFPLQPGEGLLYPGCSAPHWRDVFLGARCGQAFFHWVPKDDSVFSGFYGDPDRHG